MKILSLKMDVRCKNPGDLIIFVKSFRLRKKKERKLGLNRTVRWFAYCVIGVGVAARSSSCLLTTNVS